MGLFEGAVLWVGMSPEKRLDFHHGVKEGNAATPVGWCIAGEHVDGVAVPGARPCPAVGNDDGARKAAWAFGDAGNHLNGAAIVEHVNKIAVVDVAGGCILGCQFAVHLAFRLRMGVEV